MGAQGHAGVDGRGVCEARRPAAARGLAKGGTSEGKGGLRRATPEVTAARRTRGNVTGSMASSGSRERTGQLRGI